MGALMPRIVISYRRSDSIAIAGRIADQLTTRYGVNSVFMDIDSVPFGVDYRTNIKGELFKSDILVVLIGPNWIGPIVDGKPRIYNEGDPVRVEIETALKEGIPVLPVLVETATMPTADQLPETLKQLAFINAAPIDTGRDFHHDMTRLIHSIDGLLAGGRSSSRSSAVQPSVELPVSRMSPQRSWIMWLAVPLALAALAAGIAVYLLPEWFPSQSPSQKASVAPVTPPSPSPTTYRVLSGVSGGLQNLRAGPAVKYPIIVAIPAGSTGITIGHCRSSEDATRPWCAASWRGYSGWISSCCIVNESTGAPPRID